MDLQQLWQLAGTVWMILPGILLVAVVWWAYRPKNKKRFEDDARIPFRDDDGGQ